MTADILSFFVQTEAPYRLEHLTYTVTPSTDMSRYFDVGKFLHTVFVK